MRRLSPHSWMPAATVAVRAGRALPHAAVALGLAFLLMLLAALQARGQGTDVVKSLAEQQVIVIQDLAGGYEVDYADAGPGAFESTRPQLDALTPIVRLRIANDDTLKHLDLGGLTGLERLELSNNASLRSISGLEDLKALQTLEISNNDRLKDEIAPFNGLAELRTLRVIGNNRLRLLPDLSALTRLRDLEIVGNERLGAIKGLEGLHALEQLEVRGNGRLSELALGGRLTSLQSLAVYRNPELEGRVERPHRAARVIGVLQPVEEHMIIGGVVADAGAAAVLLEQIGRIGHRFHAARDDQVDAARGERLGAHDHRLHARTAYLVDGRRLHRFG